MKPAHKRVKSERSNGGRSCVGLHKICNVSRLVGTIGTVSNLFWFVCTVYGWKVQLTAEY